LTPFPFAAWAKFAFPTWFVQWRRLHHSVPACWGFQALIGLRLPSWFEASLGGHPHTVHLLMSFQDSTDISVPGQQRAKRGVLLQLPKPSTSSRPWSSLRRDGIALCVPQPSPQLGVISTFSASSLLQTFDCHPPTQACSLSPSPVRRAGAGSYGHGEPPPALGGFDERRIASSSLTTEVRS